MKTNVLYYGDNLEILRHRDYFPDNSVDLIYLDPPFNSRKDYNILFKESDRRPEAGVRAFSDTWHWTPATEDAYQEFLLKAPIKVGKLLEGMVDGYGDGGGWIGRNDVSAYLVMMAPRLQEMHRVLKTTGSLYLHCDPTTSHHLKMMLDQIFGAKNFQNELLWCYQGRELAKTRWNRKHDVILFYTKSKNWTFNWMPVMEPLQQTSREALARYEDEQGRKFILRYKEGGGFAPLGKEGPDTYRQYVPQGVPPRDWKVMDFARKGERLGYPTQKPLALLERIIKASSNEGDLVLDPFCGCGTALVAAQKLNRRWIGIDSTRLAIKVMSDRLQDSFPGIQFEVIQQDNLVVLR
jgi:site-specific DNA-methyltransferase (adenine-specific)